MGGYGKEVDMWSVGVMTYILLCGFTPFDEENMVLGFKQIMEGLYDFLDPYWTSVSDSAKNLIRKLLIVDPKARLSAEDALQHPWITGATAKPDLLLAILHECMAKFNTARKPKKAIHTTIATIHILNAVSRSSASSAE